jgi:hypothetical protein
LSGSRSTLLYATGAAAHERPPRSDGTGRSKPGGQLRHLRMLGKSDGRQEDLRTGLTRGTGPWVRDPTYYRCRFPAEYALADRFEHP